MKKLLLSKNIKLLGLIVGLVFIAFGSVILTNESILIFPGDSYEQMYQFYLGGWERFRSLNLSHFEWSLGFGGSSINYVYYFLTSPFFFITLLFDREWIKYSFLYVNMLKLVILFFSTRYWLKKHCKNDTAINIASISFTFSGWIFFHFAYNLFLDGIIFYPIILGLVDEYISNKKYILLVIVIGILGIVNYYMLYMFIPFILLYALFQYILKNRALEYKDMFFSAFKFVVFLILGIGISCIILLPMMSIVLDNPRFDGNQINFFSRISIKDMYKIFSSLFIPVTNRLNPNALIDISKYSFLGWGGGTGLYMIAILPLCLSLWIFYKDKYKRNIILIFYAIIAFFALFFGFYQLFQMSIDSRWFYMFNLLNCMIIAYVMEALIEKQYTNRQKSTSFIITLFIMLIVFAISIFAKLYTISLNYLLILMFVQIIFTLIWMMCFFRQNNKYFIYVIIFLEIAYLGNVFLYNNKPIESTFFNNKESSVDPIEWISNYDDGYYRVLYDGKQDGFDLYTANDAFAKNYRGVSFYNTLYNTQQEEFLNRFKGRWSMPQLRGRFESYNLTSPKYWFTYDENSLPPFGYKLIYDNEFKIYQNQYFIDLGFAYSSKIGKNEVLNQAFIHQDQIMLDYMVIEDNSENTSFNEYLNFEGIMSGIQERELILDEAISDTNLYIVNFGMPECTVNLYYQDQLVYNQSFWQYNYIDIPLINIKVDKIIVLNPEFEYNPSELYVYTKDFHQYEKWYDNIEKTMFYDVKFDGDKIFAKIDVTKDSPYIFTSIPFDKGWKVYANGKDIDYYKANLGFIGFDLQPGIYNVEFVYATPMLKEGAIISIISICVLTIMVLVRNLYGKYSK